MTRHALLGFALIVFCVAGLAVGIVRVAPGSNTGDVSRPSSPRCSAWLRLRSSRASAGEGRRRGRNG